MKQNSEDVNEWSEQSVEADARSNRDSWRRDCEQIMASSEHSSEILDLAGRLLQLLDETECMCHGGPLKTKELGELVDVLSELRGKFVNDK